MDEEEKEVIDDMLNGGEPASGHQEKYDAKALGDTIREYVRRGNVSRIVIKRRGDVLVNLPLNAGIAGGIIGAVAAPWALITAAVATAGFNCSVELVRDDGEIVDLSPRKFTQAVRDTGADVASEIRDAVDEIKSSVSDTHSDDGPAAPDEEIPFNDTEDSL